MINFEYIFEKLLEVFPLLATSFIIVLILTPVVAKIAKYLKAIDIPKFAKRRIKITGKKDKTLKSRPRLGGLAIYIAFIVLMFFINGFTVYSISIGIGLTILMIVGLIDDIKDLNGGIQMTFQVLAVMVIVLGGIRITSIHIFGHSFSFDAYTLSLPFWEGLIKVVFPADIITIIWFIVIINSMNWVAGIDALEETMSVVAGATLMLLSIRFGKDDMLAQTAIFTGAVLGFWVFNFPPAYIIGGTIGNTILGILLGIFAIKIDGKMTTSILLLALPIIDFIWVLVGRLIKYKQFNPWKLMNISGEHHFHHRLMKLGFTVKQVLLIEISIFSLFALAAYYFAGFNILAIIVFAAIVALLLFFALLTFLRVKRVNVQESEKDKGGVEPSEVKKSPESVYAY
ncbi:hypothetical protein GF362_06550 [Candidatus Dojkabacteria bacterium]|nr:hypothetical protein [Candidatus Dojkabacteria bacterium]